MARYDKLRERFEEELGDLLSTNLRLTSHLRNQDRTLPKDWAELAQFLENDEVLEALESRSRERIAHLERAIARIDDGTYDTCGACGKKIEPGRLELLPTTPICASCAR